MTHSSSSPRLGQAWVVRHVDLAPPLIGDEDDGAGSGPINSFDELEDDDEDDEEEDVTLPPPSLLRETGLITSSTDTG